MNLKKIIPQNKKGATFEGWTQGAIFSIMFVIVFAIIISGMNGIHDKSYEIEGLPTAGLETTFNNYQTSQSEKLSTGDASFTSSVGLTVSTSWDVLVGVLTMVMSFITGGWIETLFAYLHLPSIVGQLMRGLMVVALGFIILRVLFKERI